MCHIHSSEFGRAEFRGDCIHHWGSTPDSLQNGVVLPSPRLVHSVDIGVTGVVRPKGLVSGNFELFLVLLGVFGCSMAENK